MVKIYQKAPEFKTQGYFEGKIQDFSLKDFSGKWVVLFTYPLDFTFVCPTELQQFSERHDAFKRLGAQVMSLSIDSPYSHQAWSKADLKEQKYPMLSDLNHAISTAYGCYLEDKGVTLRSTYVIDPQGTVQWIEHNPLNVGRNADEVLRVVTALQTGELCGAGWKSGEQTLTKKLGLKG
ncbi:MAG: peroxiredoxin [Deltaproteobacteria bacterium]|nr:peroxiredoxin [Deltaproteobacteria bacterium]